MIKKHLQKKASLGSLITGIFVTTFINFKWLISFQSEIEPYKIAVMVRLVEKTITSGRRRRSSDTESPQSSDYKFPQSNNDSYKRKLSRRRRHIDYSHFCLEDSDDEEDVHNIEYEVSFFKIVIFAIWTVFLR